MKRKKCSRCNEKVKNSYSFCPSCGFQLKNNSDFGMLGRNDLQEDTLTNMFSGLGGGMMNKMLGGAIKMLEKEISKEFKKNNTFTQPKMRLMINGKEIKPANIKEEKPKQYLPINFSKENLEKWKKLPKKEPETNMKRFDNKIEFEIKVPGVKSVKDISILNLENSLEVKAISKKQGYLKTVPNLPLRKFSLLKEILTLEMDASNNS